MTNSSYSEEFIEQAFYCWYETNRKFGIHFMDRVEKIDGRRPSRLTAEEWSKNNGWIERADALDAEVSLKLDEEVVNKRVEMFKEHARIGSELIEKGLEYLQTEGITSDNAAIRAIDLGIETQRVSTGMAESYAKIAKMSNDAITKEIQKLIGGKTDEDEIVEGTTLETE